MCIQYLRIFEMAYNQKLNIFMNEGKRHPKAFNNSKSIHAHKPNYNIYMQKIAKALLYTGYAHNKPRELWFPPVRCVVFRNGGGGRRCSRRSAPPRCGFPVVPRCKRPHEVTVVKKCCVSACCVCCCAFVWLMLLFVLFCVLFMFMLVLLFMMLFLLFLLEVSSL